MIELYEAIVQENLEWIRQKNQANKLFQSIREKHPDEWEIVELCREALWDNTREIIQLTNEIEYARSEIKRLRTETTESE